MERHAFLFILKMCLRNKEKIPKVEESNDHSLIISQSIFWMFKFWHWLIVDSSTVPTGEVWRGSRCPGTKPLHLIERVVIKHSGLFCGLELLGYNYNYLQTGLRVQLAVLSAVTQQTTCRTECMQQLDCQINENVGIFNSIFCPKI